jgi:hypothetical protein
MPNQKHLCSSNKKKIEIELGVILWWSIWIIKLFNKLLDEV